MQRWRRSKVTYYIGPEGPLSARLAIVAEKPGRDELSNLLAGNPGRPLIGSSGRAVDRHLSQAGLSRAQVYLTNSVKRFEKLGTPTDDDIKREQPSLYRELSSLPNLNCVLVLGQAALLSLTNFHKSNMSDYRGSVLETPLGIKTIPSFHPSFYMHGEWRFKPIVDFDFTRAAQQSTFSEIRRPARTFHINPTLQEAHDLCHKAVKSKYISFDIECCRWTKWIYCISFATDPGEAFCIPIMHTNRKPYWEPRHEAQMWRLIQMVLSQPQAIYVTQNGLFDCWHLWRHGIETPHMTTGFDTMYAHRLLAPDLPHDLAFLVSLYTEEPYYKNESGSQEGYYVKAPDDQFYTYNCKDSSCTLEVAFNMMQDMHEGDYLEYFQKRMMPRWDFLMDTRKRGLRIDTSRLGEIRAKITAEKKEVEERIKSLTGGWVPNTKSFIDMRRVFEGFHIAYDYTPTGRPKINEEFLINYTYKSNKENNQEAVDILSDCIEITKRRTLESQFLTMVVDKHGYYHPSLDLSKTVSGRDSSEGDEEGGPQIQNIPLPIRVLFLPDNPDEDEISEIDLKQAESRIVAWTADESIIINAFLQGKDVYRVVGCQLYRDWRSSDLPPDDLLASIKKVCDPCKEVGQAECNHSERYMSKQARLAFGYLMGVNRFIREQAKKRVFIQYDEGKRIRDLMVNRELKAWQERTDLSLKKRQVMVNPLGRKREFYGLPDGHMTGEALSWWAQSTVSCILEIAEVRLYSSLPRTARILTQTHDSLTISHRKVDRGQILKLAEEAFYVPVMIHGRELVIPIEVAHGPNWGELR